MNRITLSNNILFTEITDLLAKGFEVTLRAKGVSMMPYIRNGKDNLVVQTVAPETLQCGDIVLAKTGKSYVAHRIIDISGNNITLKGDGNLRGTEQCQRSDILGKVMFVERNGHRIDCNKPSERRKAEILSRGWRLYLETRHLIGNILRKLKLI